MRYLRLSEPNDYKNSLWLDGPSCDEQLKTITSAIAKINTNMQEAITHSQF
jgi:hypothetical protein